MDEDNKEKDERNVPYMNETKKEDSADVFFTELHALLQAHGYSLTEEKADKLQSTYALAQEEKVNQEMPGEKSGLIASFQSYEDFQRAALQSLDGFMIILSTDGVIIFVAENITSLLGYLPDEIVGKKLLTLLPEEEKREIYRKITLVLPVSSLVGKQNEFCCHLRRGCLKHGDSPTYEYAKFIMSIKDFNDGSLALLKSFFPRQSYNMSFPTYLPLEDRFYMVGTVCILRSQVLRELSGIKETNEENIVVIQDSDEECPSMDNRSAQGQRNSRTQPLFVECPAAVANDEVALIKLEQYGSQELTPVMDVHSGTSSETSTPTLLKMLGSSSSSSSQSFEFRFEMDDADGVVKVKEEVEVEEVIQVIEYEEEEEDEEDQMEEVDEVEEDEVEENDEEEEEDQVEEALQETPSSSTMPADSSAELPLPFRSYIKERELQLTKKFKKQLEKKTQMLQAGLRIQQENMNMMKEQLKKLQDSKLQMLVAPVSHPDNLESRPSEPLFKKQRTEEMTMKALLPDLTVTRFFHSSCSCTPLKFPEELGKACSVSTQTQPLVPLELLVENKPSVCCKDENLDDQKDESFCPEDQQGFSVNPLPLANDPNAETTSASLSPPPIASESNGVKLETPRNYIQIWEQSSTSPNCLYLKQVLVPEPGAEEPSGAQAVQDPDEYSSENVSYSLSGEQPDLHEQFIHTKP
nr:PREDICTED: circadian clock protein PASD1 [Rhinolophus sinicus]